MKVRGQTFPLGLQQPGYRHPFRSTVVPAAVSSQHTAPKVGLVTFSLPSSLSGYLRPEPKSPALLWLPTALQLLHLAQPLEDQKTPATHSATSSFCEYPWPLLMGAASSTEAAPEPDPPVFIEHQLCISCDAGQWSCHAGQDGCGPCQPRARARQTQKSHGR